jgi:hypothetical protein
MWSHMNLRKRSALCGSVLQLKNFLYTTNLSTVMHFWFIFLHNILFACVDCNYFQFLGCHIHYSACIFTEKTKHRSRSLSLPFWVFDSFWNTSWHYVLKPNFSKVDACADFFILYFCSSIRFTCHIRKKEKNHFYNL